MEKFFLLEVKFFHSYFLGNDKGQLGINNFINVWNPTLIDDIQIRNTKIIEIAAGFEHSVLLTFDGKIFGMGSNNEGQIGDGRTRYPNFRKVPTPVYFFMYPYFIGIGAGSFHTIGLTNKSEIYAWGNGNQGQIGSQSFRSYPTPMKSYLTGEIRDKKVTKVYAGGNTTMALTSEGNLIVYGQGNGGQLCNNRSININNPILLKYSENFTHVSLGVTQTFLIDQKKHLYSCGNNSYGQLGIGDELNRYTLTKVKLLPVKYVSSGLFHSLASLDYDCKEVFNCNQRGSCIGKINILNI